MLIDSQIWIYFIDPIAPENKNVSLYLEGSEENGILFKEKIILNPVIPMEVAHTLFGNQRLDIKLTYEAITELFHFENVEIKEINQETLTEGLKILAKYRPRGIGGRDALLMSTMLKFNIKTIISNDKNLLSLKELRRINPVFSPPMILEVGEDFNESTYKNRLVKEYQEEKD